MEQGSRLQELAELKLALAVLSVQLEALAAKRSCSFAAPYDLASPKVDQSFALRAVLAMRRAD
jgi:hypothetical protein